MKISVFQNINNAHVEVPTSKSISNRLLIIQALAKSGDIESLSNAKDSQVLQNLLMDMPTEMNVGHAGTAFRFLTAFLTIQKGNFILTGSDRMKQRPIGILVNALKELGADISYLGQKGFPPLKITGQEINGGAISINAEVSSQFTTAMMLIGPYLKSGLTINLTGEMVSLPYLHMTAELMKRSGVQVDIHDRKITILAGEYKLDTIQVEKDWSAIAFWYEWVAIGKVPQLTILDVQKESVQGDIAVMEIFEKLGVKSTFQKHGLQLNYIEPKSKAAFLSFDLIQTPDLAQPLVVTLAAFGQHAKVIGLSTLKNKETNRGQALKQELAKFGVTIKVTNNSIEIDEPTPLKSPKTPIQTYDDHRMAMAFAPLVGNVGAFYMNDIEVVEKSYPDYWSQLRKVGVNSEP